MNRRLSVISRKHSSVDENDDDDDVLSASDLRRLDDDLSNSDDDEDDHSDDDHHHHRNHHNRSSVGGLSLKPSPVAEISPFKAPSPRASAIAAAASPSSIHKTGDEAPPRQHDRPELLPAATRAKLAAASAPPPPPPLPLPTTPNLAETQRAAATRSVGERRSPPATPSPSARLRGTVRSELFGFHPSGTPALPNEKDVADAALPPQPPSPVAEVAPSAELVRLLRAKAVDDSAALAARHVCAKRKVVMPPKVCAAHKWVPHQTCSAPRTPANNHLNPSCMISVWPGPLLMPAPPLRLHHVPHTPCVRRGTL